MTTLAPPLDGSFVKLARLLLEVLWTQLLTVPMLLFIFLQTIFRGEGKDLRNKVVLITGTGNGLGKELALQFARQGSRVICVDVQDENNQRTVQEIRQVTGDSRSAVGFKCDVSNTTQVEELKVKVMEEVTAVDILVNNAGVLYSNSTLTGTEENIRRVLDINVLSGYWMTRAFLPGMRERNEGHIVFICSMTGLHNGAKGSIYGSSKFAVRGMALALNDELQQETNGRIKVSTVYPYFINTNQDFMDSIDMRVPPLKTSEVARQTIRGVRQEMANFCVPGGWFIYFLMAFHSIMPYEIFNMYRKVFYVEPKLPEKDDEFVYIPKKAEVAES